MQIIGITLGLLYLWLEYRADIRLWIVGLIMPLIHGMLYYRAGLYADCSMQAYYVLAGLYGWIVWRRARRAQAGAEACKGASDCASASVREHGGAARICRTPAGSIPALLAAYTAVHVGIYLILTRFTDSSVPFWDALTTALSVVAMWMLSRKYLEQWLVWLVVDLITAGLYVYKDIPLTGGLYLLYSALAVAGFFRWRRSLARGL